MEETGTKPINISLDFNPREYLAISDKHISDKSLFDKLEPGSVWLCGGKEHSFDEQLNYYVFRRVDYGVL